MKHTPAKHLGTDPEIFLPVSPQAERELLGAWYTLTLLLAVGQTLGYHPKPRHGTDHASVAKLAR